MVKRVRACFEKRFNDKILDIFANSKELDKMRVG